MTQCYFYYLCLIMLFSTECAKKQFFIKKKTTGTPLKRQKNILECIASEKCVLRLLENTVFDFLKIVNTVSFYENFLLFKYFLVSNKNGQF